uniref:TrbI/VirB10 family protein n=1 Tax=uncultured Sphingomonas sp. TaxID=158754 RepID=UPI0025F2E6B8|nr:TrbI/VirB10 family protein [uncultured Sphingomonas sp.]
MDAAKSSFAPTADDIVSPANRPHGTLVPYDPRRDMDDVALVEASRMAYPAVAARSAGKDKAGLVAGTSVAVVLGLATFWGLSSGRDAQRAVAPPPTAAVAETQQAVPVIPPPTPEQLAAMDPSSAAAPQSSLVFSSPPPTYAPVALPGTQPAAAAGPTAADRLRSPTLLYDSSGSVAADPSPAAAEGAAAGSPVPAKPATGQDEFAARADASASESATATRMVDPASTVSQGTLIPAVLETTINSDLPGFARAVVSQDVRSFDGSRVLIPRSSRLIGQYRSGLAAGQTRVYVLWSRLIRPDGVSVAIASPGTDEAGTSGLTGDVKGHFFKRFGSAMLLSVVGAASAIGTGGASLLLSGGGSAAGVAAQQNGAIPPTVRVQQGHPIRVFTARDLNFSQVSTATRP